MSYDHITYCDFQELDREQLKILFNKLIEKITIHEFSVPGEKEVCLNIVIDLKIPGYAPKYALQFKQDLKNREKEDKKKNTNNHKNESSYLDGGEGSCTAEIPTFDTNLPSDLNQLDIFYVFIISQ